jgi:hypothetical protein
MIADLLRAEARGDANSAVRGYLHNDFDEVERREYLLDTALKERALVLGQNDCRRLVTDGVVPSLDLEHD